MIKSAFIVLGLTLLDGGSHASDSSIPFNEAAGSIETLARDARAHAAAMDRGPALRAVLDALVAANPEQAAVLLDTIPALRIQPAEFKAHLAGPVERLATHPDAAVRVNVIRAVARIESIKTVTEYVRSEMNLLFPEAINPFFYDEDPAVRIEAARAFAGVTILKDSRIHPVDEQARLFLVPFLAVMEDDSDANVRAAATAAYAEIEARGAYSRRDSSTRRLA